MSQPKHPTAAGFSGSLAPVPKSTPLFCHNENQRLLGRCQSCEAFSAPGTPEAFGQRVSCLGSENPYTLAPSTHHRLHTKRANTREPKSLRHKLLNPKPVNPKQAIYPKAEPRHSTASVNADSPLSAFKSGLTWGPASSVPRGNPFFNLGHVFLFKQNGTAV